MKKIEFSKEAKATIVASIRRYFEAELDQPIGVLPAEFLLDFFADEIGAHYYNQGLRDAHARRQEQRHCCIVLRRSLRI
ncbi:DUF2164 domain-containing protein [Rhizobium leguminosarum bv. viciae]|uniref:DUF2164 domain-containing protein n=1 Tax=Rhizobium leguminosarum TaxID=384 RepID=UPI00103C8C55|nr:DUF2164 domain-containing protein [Rhizobium leguminosarum]TCA52355.1 DUF2164 domain-containing protein [Rhizobium leguminosarum bv. viciae]